MKTPLIGGGQTHNYSSCSQASNLELKEEKAKLESKAKCRRITAAITSIIFWPVNCAFQLMCTPSYWKTSEGHVYYRCTTCSFNPCGEETPFFGWFRAKPPEYISDVYCLYCNTCIFCACCPCDSATNEDFLNKMERDRLEVLNQETTEKDGRSKSSLGV